MLLDLGARASGARDLPSARNPRLGRAAAGAPPPPAADGPRGHVVLVGHGRVGAPVADELARHGVPHVIVEQSRAEADALRARGLPVIAGDAARPEVLGAARLDRAWLVVVAAPDAFQARAILALARRLNPAAAAFVGERELAVSLARATLQHAGVAPDMAAVAARTLHPA